MKRIFKYLVVLVLSALLTAVPDGAVYAQQKKPATTKTTTQKSGTKKKPAQGTQRKPTQGTQRKPTQSTQKKPAQGTKRKPAQSTQKKSAQTSSGKGGQRSSGSRKKGKPMSRQAYEKQQKDLQRQIKDTEKLINTNNKSLKSQNRDLQIRADEIRKRQALINSKSREIETLIAEEDSLRHQILNLERQYGATQKKYAAAMRHLYKWRSGYDELLFVVSARDLLEGIRRVRYLRRYGEWRKSQAELLEQQRNATHEAKQLLELVRVDHEIILEDLDKERAALAQRQQEQQTQMANLQKRNKELQGELDRDRKRMAEVEKTIQRMIEEEIRKAEEARRKAEEEARRKEEAARKARDAKSKDAAASKGSTGGLGSTATKSSGTSPSRTTTHNSATVKKDDAFRRLSGSFADNRGRLPYPLDATFAFVDHYNPGNGNSSIVLSTRVGAHACSIYEGVVQSCFKTSEEWTVIVQHGNYRSVYMNLQNVFVRAGQKVSTRQQLGTLKTEPESNRAEIRFWIYQNANAVNPERWLKR